MTWEDLRLLTLLRLSGIRVLPTGDTRQLNGAHGSNEQIFGANKQDPRS
jgi:hypothetical protein